MNDNLNDSTDDETNNKTNDKKKFVSLIISITVIIVLAVFISGNYFGVRKKDSSSGLKTNIENQIEDIQSKFETLSKEIVSEDNKTLKAGYSEEQQKMFTAVLSQVMELDKFVEDNKQNTSITQEEYYNQLSEKVNLISDTIDALDISVHTNTDDFETTFTNLSNMFIKFKERAVSEDNISLKDEYKQYQGDFEAIVKDILSLSEEIETDNKNQQYFDNLTKKGNELTARLKSLAQKVNISLE